MIASQYLLYQDALLHVQSSGAGRPLVLLHTAGQSGWQWREQLLTMPEFGYRVVVPDLPGHGFSDPAPTGPVDDLAKYADVVEWLVGTLNLDAPVVVGCSMGGKVALELATRQQCGLAGVIAMEADGFNGQQSVSGLRRSLSDSSSPSRTDRTYLGALSSVGHRVTQKRAERIATMHQREDPRVTVSDQIGWSTHDLRADLQRISCPCLLVAGDEDPWLDAAVVRATAAAITGARYIELTGYGHYPMEEIEDFTSVLKDWLDDLDLGTPVTPTAFEGVSL